MLTTTSAFLRAVFTEAAWDGETLVLRLADLSDIDAFDRAFLVAFEDAPYRDDFFYRVEDDGVILARLELLPDGPRIRFSKTVDPTEEIGFDPRASMEEQVQSLADAAPSSVTNPRTTPGRAKTAYGGFRITIGHNARRERDRALDIEKTIKARRAGRRGIAKRIAAARRWHQGVEGARWHRAQARYQQQHSSIVKGMADHIVEAVRRRFHKGVGECRVERGFDKVQSQPVHLRAFASGADLATGDMSFFFFGRDGTLRLVDAVEVVGRAALREMAVAFRFKNQASREQAASEVQAAGGSVQRRGAKALVLTSKTTPAEIAAFVKIVGRHGGSRVRESIGEKEFFGVSFDPELIGAPGYSLRQYKQDTGKVPWNIHQFFSREERKEAASIVANRIRRASGDSRTRGELWLRIYGSGGERRYKKEGEEFEKAMQGILDGTGPSKPGADKRHDAQVYISGNAEPVPVEVKNSGKTTFRVTELEAGRGSGEVSEILVHRHPSDDDPENADQIDVYMVEPRAIRVGTPEKKGGQENQRRIVANVKALRPVATVHERRRGIDADLDPLAVHDLAEQMAAAFGYGSVAEMPCGAVYVERHTGEAVATACDHLLTDAQMTALRVRWPEVCAFEDHYDPLRLLRECALSVALEGSLIELVGPRSWVVDGERLVFYSPRSKVIQVLPLGEQGMMGRGGIGLPGNAYPSKRKTRTIVVDGVPYKCVARTKSYAGSLAGISIKIESFRKELFINFAGLVQHGGKTLPEWFEYAFSRVPDFVRHWKDNKNVREDAAKSTGGIPSFLSYEDAQDWISKKEKEYGNKNRFHASDEYKKVYLLIQQLYREAREPLVKQAARAMEEVGAKEGDRVVYTVVSPYGFADDARGIIVMSQGVPYVKLDAASAAAFNRKKTRWHKGFVSEAVIETTDQQEDAFDNASLRTIMLDVKKHATAKQIKDAWAYKTKGLSGYNFEFHGPDDFFWHGQASSLADAKVQGWTSWLRSIGAQGYGFGEDAP